MIDPSSQTVSQNARASSNPMPESWLVRVYNDRLISFVKECTGPLELGRQNDRTGEELYQVSQGQDGHSRIAIAPVAELKISRRLAWLEADRRRPSAGAKPEHARLFQRRRGKPGQTRRGMRSRAAGRPELRQDGHPDSESLT